MQCYFCKQSNLLYMGFDSCWCRGCKIRGIYNSLSNEYTEFRIYIDQSLNLVNGLITNEKSFIVVFGTFNYIKEIIEYNSLYGSFICKRRLQVNQTFLEPKLEDIVDFSKIYIQRMLKLNLYS